MSRLQWSRERWRHVTPKGQSRDPDIFEAQYLDNRDRHMVGSYWLQIGNHTLGIQWSHDRWRHVTRKVKVVTPIHLNLNISITRWDRRSVLIEHLWEPHVANGDVTEYVTWPKKSRSWPRYLWSLISQQQCEIHGRFILTTNRKPHLGNPVVTWPMTSRDP